MFTEAEIEKMRLFVNEHDKKMTTSQTLDLNNPPRKPYVHQELPRLVYRDGRHKHAHTEEQLAEALADGWTKTPAAEIEEDGAPELDAESAAEAAKIDKQIADLNLKQKKRGK